jgi:Uma2 family endonuclease
MTLTVREFLNKVEHEPALQQGLATLLDILQIPDPLPLQTSYEQFLEWADEDTLAEWQNGEVLMASPASDRHQDLVRFLVSVVGIYVETRDLGIIRPAPFQMKLEAAGREPDLLFVAREHLDRVKTSYLDGPADLVVEIISLESVERDRGTKFVEYEAAGIPEYWLIDPLRSWAEFYQLNTEGRYSIAFAGKDGKYHAHTIPGLWLRVDWLWQTPLPPVLDVMRELQLI